MRRDEGNWNTYWENRMRLRWTPFEALEQSRAMLPDAGYAEKYGLQASFIKELDECIDAYRGVENSLEEVLPMLMKARRALPKAWPENAPQDAFAAVDRAIAAGCRELLASCPQDATIGEMYDDPLVADVINTLLPGFEFPDWSHRRLSNFLNTVEIQERSALLVSLVEMGIAVAHEGQHIGKIVDIEHGVAVQDVGRGVLAAHSTVGMHREMFTVGSMLQVTYNNGAAKVVDMSEAARSQAGVGR